MHEKKSTSCPSDATETHNTLYTHTHLINFQRQRLRCCSQIEESLSFPRVTIRQILFENPTATERNERAREDLAVAASEFARSENQY